MPPQVEAIEGRLLLAAFLVTSTGDSGPGTLRQAIDASNSTPGANVINFNINSASMPVIAPASALDPITNPATIDGASEPGFGLVVIDGSSAGAGVNGLAISAGNTTVDGLEIVQFAGSGILLTTGGHDTIANDLIGIDVVTDGGMGNGGDGVTIVDSSDNEIDSNVISGNNGNGIALTGASTGNIFRGNSIGTDLNGNSPVGNGQAGISVASSGNLIGGTDSTALNLISGNKRSGVRISSAASGNVVEGNFLGTNGAGSGALGNVFGVSIIDSSYNTVADNVVSGNLQIGIQVFAQTQDASGNQIRGNRIGTTADGLNALGNGFGIIIAALGSHTSASQNLIGGTAPADSNLVSGNLKNGIEIDNSGAMNNLVQGNRIGTDASGSKALGNGGNGVRIGGATNSAASASNNTIGGTAQDAGNLISGNGARGIQIDETSGGGTGNSIQGNQIGTTLDGLHGLGNTSDGILVVAPGNTIGGSDPNARNIISGNGGNGILLNTAAATLDVIEGNYIGTDLNGTGRLPNSANGVLLSSTGPSVPGPSSNVIGGTSPGAGNVISGNLLFGIQIVGTGGGGSMNLVAGNTIGATANGKDQLANFTGGVSLVDAPSNTIGGTTAGAVNEISGNNSNGIDIRGARASNNLIEGNIIGLERDGVTGLGNFGTGISITNSSNVTIGGTTPEARNLISANLNGVKIATDPTEPNGTPGVARGNVVEGNYIGTDASGTLDQGNLNLGNTGFGVGLFDSPENTIGGTTAGAGNLISDNESGGIEISGAGSTGNLVQGNTIGTDKKGSILLGNFLYGIDLSNASSNTIGGTAPGAGNLISGNLAGGIHILLSHDDVVEGNDIGTLAGGVYSPTSSNKILSNDGPGIFIATGQNNVIGGTTAGARNVISGNQGPGVKIDGTFGTSMGNVVEGNYIGTDVTGTHALGNVADGILIVNNSSGNTIGGTTPGAGNVISGNGASGVNIIGPDTMANLVQGNDIGVDPSGSLGLGNSADGVIIQGSSSDANTIGGMDPNAANVIGGNIGNGIQIALQATGNQVFGNFLGINETGIANVGNTANGIFLNDAPGNLIGGAANAAGNHIEHSGGNGVYIFSSGNMAADSNDRVLGNLIVSNAQSGVYINASNHNVIGGTAPGEKNLIISNGRDGILVYNRATGNVILGNDIGTDPSGTIPLGNFENGIAIVEAPSNTIGGVVPGAANLIENTLGNGILINGGAATGNRVVGNFVGTNASGVVKAGNTLDGIRIEGAPGNTIGGPSNSERNVLSGNGGNGVAIVNAPGNSLRGNEIGVDPGGSTALPNTRDGINISGTAGVVIGGVASGSRNLISGNLGNGITIANSTSVSILGNFIGTDIQGTDAIANGNDGVLIDESPENVIGGTDTGARNVISGNRVAGVEIQNAASSGNTVLGNYIGPDASGSALMGQATNESNLVGVYINAAPGNTIGGLSPGDGNLISGNSRTDASGIGIQILGLGASGNRVLGNDIGTDATGTRPLGNDTGIFITGAPGNTIGGSSPTASNDISGNGAIGIQIFGRGATGNTVEGNLIGVVASGKRLVLSGRAGLGILVNSTSAVGNPTPSTSTTTRISGNVISGFLVGVELFAPQPVRSPGPSVVMPGSFTMIQGNFVGTDKDGKAVLGNTEGIFINGVPGNLIGGTTASERNIISGNDTGIYVFGSTAYDNLIEGNFIGLDVTGQTPAGNHVGIYLDGATYNTIGGPSPADRNVIAGNKRSGNDGSIAIFYFNKAAHNVALNNFIGTDVNGKGGKGFGQGDYGVLLFNAANNQPNRLGSRTNRIVGSGIAPIREFTGPATQGASSRRRHASRPSGGAKPRIAPHSALGVEGIPHGPMGAGHRHGRLA